MLLTVTLYRTQCRWWVPVSLVNSKICAFSGPLYSMLKVFADSLHTSACMGSIISRLLVIPDVNAASFYTVFFRSIDKSLHRPHSDTVITGPTMLCIQETRWVLCSNKERQGDHRPESWWRPLQATHLLIAPLLCIQHRVQCSVNSSFAFWTFFINSQFMITWVYGCGTFR